MEAMMRIPNRLLAILLRILIWVYRLVLSPVLGQNCRFQPTCSAYALDAVAAHGPWRGAWLALRRVVRCHPWGSGGYDPVPEATARPVPQGRQAS